MRSLYRGGLLAGVNIEKPDAKGRFDQNHAYGQRYWKNFGHLVPAVERLKETLVRNYYIHHKN